MNEIVQERLRHFQAERELPDLDEPQLFEVFAAHCVLHQFHEERFAPDAHQTGGGNDLGVDAWGIVVNGELYHDLDGVKNAAESFREMNVVVVAVQAKTSTSAEGKVVADLADNLRQICGREPIAYTASPEILELQQALHVLYDHHDRNAVGSPRLEAWYVHCGGDPNEDLLAKCRSAERTVEALDRFESVSFEVAGSRRVQRLYQRSNRKVRASFDWPSKIGMAGMDGVKQAWTGMLPASELVGRILVDEGGSIRKFLFEDNLREYLGQSNEINDDIARTLADEAQRKRFAVLNNGITVIAESFDASGENCTLADFQIVNGCQTGHVLFENRHQLTDDVQVKLTVIETEDESIAEAITQATNRQTLIAKESLAADPQIHRNIEAYFRTSVPPRDLYYERRAGQFDGDRSVTRTRVLNQNQLTQSYAAVFRNRVHEATRPAKLLKDDKLAVYRTDTPPIAYYTAASIWYQVDWLLRNNRVDRIWKPARFLLMAAAVHRLSGGRRPPATPRKTKAYCDELLERIWDREKVERCVEALIPDLDRHWRSEAPGHRLAELVRTKGFTDRFLRAVQEPH
ncbi:AIPR family protein [Glycomyces xiaoerkulensis]|uniref:AIPR family protein n=1 Tax=Glycomyces xiaoerkulensis TaxID=2038139 RepID=UPI000C2662DC|nr:AIPR family protein [Glycomyces xiaoerkulensis]